MSKKSLAGICRWACPVPRQSDIRPQFQEPAPSAIAVYRRTLTSFAAVGAIAGGLVGYWNGGDGESFIR
jgi:hypothetical protein